MIEPKVLQTFLDFSTQEDDTMNLTAQKRYREWAAQIDAQQSSGLTQREWCRAHGITYEAFKYRKGRLETLAAELMNAEAPSSGENDIALIPASVSVSESLDLVQSAFSSTAHSMRIDLEHATISVTNNIDPSVLRAALEVLKDA
jgi:hypothetical protein